MTIIRVDELGEKPQVLVELFGEFAVFLVPPTGAEGFELGRQHGRLVREDGVELFEPLREGPQLLGIDDRLRHAVLPGDNSIIARVRQGSMQSSTVAKQKKPRGCNPWAWLCIQLGIATLTVS